MESRSRRAVSPPPSSGAGARAREQLLEAAGEVFAALGYDRATSREICERAGMNTAAVNYHFGGIEALYVETVGLAHRRVVHVEEFEALASSALSAREKLRAFLRPMIRQSLDRGAASWELRLLSREIISPTQARGALLDEGVLPQMRPLKAILAELLGARPEEPVVGRALLTVFAPSLLLALASRAALEGMLPTVGEASELPELLEHIERFVLAGLEATARVRREPSRVPRSKKSPRKEKK